MSRIIVTGCGTDVGKTVVSAILTLTLEGEYWKPVECGDSDTPRVTEWIGTDRVHSPSYALKAPLSPHHAARLEGKGIDLKKITPPSIAMPLIIETAGGIYVPFNETTLSIDLFSKWEAIWVVVIRHYVGSINHTLLTLEALKNRGITPSFFVFNGHPNDASEQAILHFSGLERIPFLRLLPEKNITFQTLKQYGSQWLPQLKI